MFSVFQDELEANAQRFFLQPVGRNILNIVQKVFFLVAVRTFLVGLSKDFLNSILGDIIVSNPTNVRKVTA